MTDSGDKPWPRELRLAQGGKLLSIAFAGGENYELPAEYLRVESPSAEVKGHGPGQAITVGGKRDVKISNVEAVGNYAVRISFSDGHSSGLYSWDYLFELGAGHDRIWRDYCAKLDAEGLSRDAR